VKKVERASKLELLGATINLSIGGKCKSVRPQVRRLERKDESGENSFNRSKEVEKRGRGQLRTMVPKFEHNDTKHYRSSEPGKTMHYNEGGS